MSEILINLFASYGLPGLVILGMAYALLHQDKAHRADRKERDAELFAERNLWHEERKAWAETNERYIETSIEVIQSNSKAMAELTAYISHEFNYPKNRNL